MRMRAVGYIEDANSYFRDLIFPEEDRHLFTTAPWHGGYRWFRSPNLVLGHNPPLTSHFIVGTLNVLGRHS